LRLHLPLLGDGAVDIRILRVRRYGAPGQEHDGEQERERRDHAAPDGRHAPPSVSYRCATTVRAPKAASGDSMEPLGHAAESTAYNPLQAPQTTPDGGSDRLRCHVAEEGGIPHEGKYQSGDEARTE